MCFWSSFIAIYVSLIFESSLYLLSCQTNSRCGSHPLTQQSTTKSERFKMVLTWNVFHRCVHKRQPNTLSDTISHFPEPCRCVPTSTTHCWIFRLKQKFSFVLCSKISVFNFPSDRKAESNKFIPVFTCICSNGSWPLCNYEKTKMSNGSCDFY